MSSMSEYVSVSCVFFAVLDYMFACLGCGSAWASHALGQYELLIVLSDVCMACLALYEPAERSMV